MIGLLNGKPRLRTVRVEEEFASVHETLAHEQASLLLRIECAKAFSLPQPGQASDQYSKDAAKAILRVGDEAEAVIDAVADKRLDYAAPLRQFMLNEGVNRPARKSRPVSTTLTLQACLLIEAGATAALLAGDGYMSIPAALMTGTVFSGTNIALGVSTGFLGLRGSRYRAQAPQPKRWDRAIRIVSAGCTALGGAVMGCMLFAAARVRVIGDHAGIWDWDKASFAATFNDYSAVALLVIGALSSVIAVREGWGQLSDPIWGYSRITKETERQISDAIDAAYESGLERLEAALDRPMIAIAEAIADSEEAHEERCSELQELREDVSRFNTDLKLTLARLTTAKDAEAKRRQYLEGQGRKAEPVTLELAALKALKIDPKLIPNDPALPGTSQDVTRRLEDAFEEASFRLDAAHASASSFVTHPFF